MKKWLTSIFVLLSLAGGVAAGMPLHSGAHAKKMSCCKKMKSGQRPTTANAARLGCALNCSDPASTSGQSTSTVAFLKPSASIAGNFAPLTAARRVQGPSAFRPEIKITQERRPLFLRHHSFLI